MSARPITVTLSAPFGAGGSAVGPKLAQRLGVPFYNRAIATAVSAELGIDLESVLVHDGRAPTGVGRLLSAVGRMQSGPLGGLDGYLFTEAPLVDEKEIAERTAAVVRDIADGDGGVILGRASAIVLAGHPNAVHVRLEGPTESRIKQAMQLSGMDEKTARARQGPTDAAREAYAKRLFGRDPRDPLLYHLVLNSSAISWDACVEIMLTAVAEVIGPRE
jgi:cytidylate kinase